MSHSPQQEAASKTYQDAWRAVNLLIRSDGSWSGRERNVCYQNQGDGTFRDAAYLSGLDLNTDGRAFVPFDLDSDGDLDLILKNRSGRQLRAFRNEMNDAPRMLAVRAVGTKSNRDGVGARLMLETDRRTLVREIASGSGFLSQRPRQAEFGLEPDERPERLSVAWAGGETADYDDLPAAAGVWLATEGGGLEAVARPRASNRESEPETAPRTAGVPLAEPVPAPEFELDTLDGSRAALLRPGGWTLVNFWATWCPPCRKEMADFASQSARLREAGVTVAAVSVDDPADRAKVQAFADELNLEFPVLYASDDAVNAYTVLQHNLLDRRVDLAIPTSFLVDESGDVRALYRGETEVDRILADLGAGSALPFDGRWIVSAPDRDWVALGASYAERGLERQAIAAFERAREDGVRSSELSNNFAGALIQVGELDRAETLLREAREADPDDLDVAVNLATTLLARGDAAGALALVGQATAARPDDAAALTIQGTAEFALGRLAEAERSYRAALAVDPARADAHENLGGVLGSTNRLPEAIEALERAAELGAASVKLYSNLGVLHMQTGSPARGLESFQKAVALDPSDYGANLNLAIYYAQSGDPAAARDWAAKANAIAPERPEARELLEQLPR